MGYYTEFDLEVEAPSDWPVSDDEAKAEVLAWLRQQKETYPDPMNPDVQTSYRVYDPICDDDESDSYAKWYGHEADMGKAAVQFPAYWLILHGKGEDCTGEDDWDEWRKTWHGPDEMVVERVVSVQLIWKQVKP